MNHVPQPQEEKLGYFFQSETCPWALKTHVFSKISSVSRLLKACNQCYPNNIKNTKKNDKTNRIFSSSINEII